jgi:ferredoxin
MRKTRKATDVSKFALTLTCAECGAPINRTSAYFGMDCANACGEKAYRRGDNTCNISASAKKG